MHNCLLPYDLEIPPDMSRIKGILYCITHFIFLIRWESKSTNEDSQWWRVIFSGEYILENLKKKVRYEIRKGLKNYSYHEVSKEEIKKLGYEVYKSSYIRYETHEKMMPKNFFIDQVESMPKDIEFRALYNIESGAMEAFVENIVQDKECFMSTMWLDPLAMQKNAGYAFFHEILNEYINIRDFKHVSDGSRNISHETGIHEFLRNKFNFYNSPMKINIIYNPLIYPLVKICFLVKNIFPKNSKISSLLRLEFYARKKS